MMLHSMHRLLRLFKFSVILLVPNLVCADMKDTMSQCQ